MCGLNTWAFVKVEKILRGIEVKVDDMIHFRKEIRVGDGQKVLMQIRAKSVGIKTTPDGRMTRSTTEDIAVSFEVFRSPSG